MVLFEKFPVSFIQTFGLSTFCSIDLLKRIENDRQYYWFWVMQYLFKHILLFKDFNFAQSCPIRLLFSFSAGQQIHFGLSICTIIPNELNQRFKIDLSKCIVLWRWEILLLVLGHPIPFLSRKRQQAKCALPEMKS